ncbi:MAG: hypothetical protein WD423_06185 [Rhodothermales bacterium]
MNPFNMEHFTRRLVAETLFYDEEYGAIGSLSLIDTNAGKERFIASFMPEDGSFVIEEATEWEDGLDEDAEIGYALAVDSKEHAAFDAPEAAADALLGLANQYNLMPSITLLFEEDEVA